MNSRKINFISRCYLLSFLLFFSGCVITSAEKEQIQIDIANIKRELELYGKNSNALSENLKKEKADISASLDGIKEEMAFLKGRFEESKFEAQKAKEALETVQSKVIDSKEIAAKFAAIQASFAAMEKQTADNAERIKGLEEKIASIEKEALLTTSKKEGNEKAADEYPKPEALYAEGFQQIKEKDFDRAVETFKNFISLFPDHDLADNAQYWIGEAYYAQKDYERAVVEFNEVIKKYPKGDKTAASMVKQAVAFYELGNKKEAKHILERVRSKYPDTEEASTAKKKLEEIKK